MGKKKYNWETKFETAKSLMVHTFTDRVKVEANLKRGEVLVLVDGHTVNAYYGKMPVKEYECLLLGVEEYANQLKRKDQFKEVAIFIFGFVAAVTAALLLTGNL